MSSRPIIPKIKRKPPPVVDIDDLDTVLDNAKDNTRYPTPDPSDPFAPLWVLRTRNSNNSLKQALAIPIDASQAHRRAKSTPPSAISFPATDNFIAAAENNVDLDPPANSKWHQRLLSTKRVVKASTPIPALESLDSSYVHIPSPLPLSSFPTPAQLAHAASLPLIAPSGLRIPFSSLFTSPYPTLIIFLRHFWCPHSQDYVASLARHLPFLNSSVHIVLISNGAPAFIPKYLSLFGLEECEMYTDPTCAAYRALGLSTVSDSKTAVDRDHRAPAANSKSGGGGGGGVGGMAKVVLRALKGGLPVWERGGNTDQLGGEFVFSPGEEVTCAYAHRMRSSKDHAPIQHVLAAAGPGQHFGQHYDDSVRDPTTGAKSEWTLLIYLTGIEDGVQGGETLFYKDERLTRGKPEVITAPLTRGTALLHRHGQECMLHEGSEVIQGNKYVLRSDLMFMN
ncbi:hypothetical protein H0H93_003833 [Arthromyces matolae]|nr:hypothetical protein H0H93_003833 [Arthromyces matolae]